MYLEDMKKAKTLEAELEGKSYEFILDKEHQWSS